jgi:putative membrane protein insertion efficiency factor
VSVPRAEMRASGLRLAQGQALRQAQGRSFVAGIFGFYKRFVSPLLPPACRFYPTCSEYAAEAVRRHGVGKGLTMAAGRLLRCHPWHRGGFDPVPGEDRTHPEG